MQIMQLEGFWAVSKGDTVGGFVELQRGIQLVVSIFWQFSRILTLKSWLVYNTLVTLYKKN